MGEPRTWSVELDVREDAPSMFIPVEQLPDAVGGDLVTVTSANPAKVRHGQIVELLDDATRGRFLTVSFEEPRHDETARTGRSLESFRALSFDCYGTLIDWEAGIAGELTPWAAGHEIAASSDELLALFSAHESEVEAEHPTARYPDVLAMTLEHIADHFGVTTTPTERASFGSSVSRWPAFADSVEALARLHQRYKLIILSNVDRASFAASNERLGVDFDLIITAEDVGSYKPSAPNFRALLDGVASIGIDAPGLVHVAQSLFHDHEPAKAHELPTVWIDRRQGRPGFGATPPPQTDVRPDWTFPSMKAFADAATDRPDPGSVIRNRPDPADPE